MPEICEIVLIAQYLTTKIINDVITDIEISSGKYTHKQLDGLNFLKNNKNTIISINTKGKFLWFELRNENNEILYIMNWFGLTGEWSFKPGNNDRIILHLTNNEKLYFSDPRNFGIIQITNDISVLNNKLNSLANDLLKTNFTNKQYLKWFRDFLTEYPKYKNIPIVAFLLEQNKNKTIGSGIGNYLSAEILYRAKISPYRPLDTLSDDDIFVLADTIKFVLKMCYMTNKTGYMVKLGDFVDEHKQLVLNGVFPDYHPEIKIKDLPSFDFFVYRKKTDPLGNKVLADEIKGTGRTTYWVKEIQK